MVRGTIWRGLVSAMLTGALTTGLGACHGLLDVSDPTLIRDQDIANANGANGRRINAVGMFMSQFGVTAMDVGIFTDELGFDESMSPLTITEELALDQRDSEGYEGMHNCCGDGGLLGGLDWAVSQSSIAIPAVRQYISGNLKGDYLAQLFAYRGHNLVQMAEIICAGFPINDVSADNVPILGGPHTPDSAFVYAITQLDSALANVKDSAVYDTLARVLKGRALLDLGRFDEAAAAVTGVSTSFAYYTNPEQFNRLYVCPGCDWSYTGFPVGDGEGGNGLHFVSEHDSVRVPTRYMQGRINDATKPEYTQMKYSTNKAPYVIADGREARLIQAEVALHGHDGSWLTILNDLRSPVGLDPLADPGSDSARVDLVYHERAFWLFLTGHRLGDLRRLMRNYGRKAEDIYPTGSYPLIGQYRDGTAIPFSFGVESLYNDKLTTGCTTR